MRLTALFRLAFAPAPGLPSLSLAAYRDSQAHSTKGTPPPSRAATSCGSMVSGSLSLPSPGFFSPFPHGTRSLSVAARYSALDRGRPGFGQGSSCPALLRYRIMESVSFRLRGSHALRRAFPCPSATRPFSLNSTGHPHAALQPRSWRFGLLPFRSPLLGESLLISFPALLRWFTSRSMAPRGYFIHRPRCRDLSLRVTPFGHPRFTGCVPLPAACRGLPRPSSPVSSSGIRHGPLIAWPYPPSRLRGKGDMPSYLHQPRRAPAPRGSCFLPFSFPVKDPSAPGGLMSDGTG